MAKYEVKNHIKGLPHTAMTLDVPFTSKERAQSLCDTMMRVRPDRVYFVVKVA